MDLYNDGTVCDIGEPSNNPNMKEMAYEFSEGNTYLEKLLLSCWENNIKTFACCSGDEEDDINAYISFIVNQYSENLINRIVELVEKEYSDSVAMDFYIISSAQQLRFQVSIYDKNIKDELFNKIQNLINSNEKVNDKYLYQAKIIADYFYMEKQKNLEYNFRYYINNFCCFYEPNVISTNVSENLLDAINFFDYRYYDYIGVVTGLTPNKLYNCNHESIDRLCMKYLLSLIHETDYNLKFMNLPMTFKQEYINIVLNKSQASSINKMYSNNLPIMSISENSISINVNKDSIIFVKKILDYVSNKQEDDITISFENLTTTGTVMVLNISKCFDKVYNDISLLDYNKDIPYDKFSSAFVEFDVYALVRNLKYKLIKNKENMYIVLGNNNYTFINFETILNHLEATGELVEGHFNCNEELLTRLSSYLENSSVKLVSLDSVSLKSTGGYHK